MPHIIIEHSDNILASDALKIGAQIQQIMAEIVEGNFDPNQCKVRSTSYKNYLVGLENVDLEKTPQDFIHLSIKILAGRSLEIRQKLASQSFDFIKKFYNDLNISHQRCDVSVDIIEMARDTYQKISLIK